MLLPYHNDVRHVGIAVVLLTILALSVVGYEAYSKEGRVDRVQESVDDGVVRIVILGDSVAHGAGDERGVGIAGPLEQHLQTHKVNGTVQNFGVNGARTSGTRRLLRGAAIRRYVSRADIVVLSIGGNDLYGDRIAQMFSGVLPALSQNRTLANVEEVVSDISEINHSAKIYVLGLYNPYRRSANGVWLDEQVNRWDARLIMRFATDRQVTVMRICDLLQTADRISTLDRFHPGAKGYATIAGRIVSSL